MSNVTKNQKISDRLNLLKDMEMMPDELNRMLEAELSKCEEEMDIQLIDELLKLLEAQTPTQEEKDKCWLSVQKSGGEARSNRMRRITRRSIAVAAAVVVLLAMSVGTVSAFRWTFLWKLFAPLAETFGIFSASNLESDTDDPAPIEGMITYSIQETEYAQVNYKALEEMPHEVNGFKIVPGWIPERFTFIQGSIYEDPEIVRAGVTYEAGDELLSLTLIHYLNDDDISSYVFEKNTAEPVTESISGVDVTYYNNREEKQLSAAWLDQNMVHLIRGAVTEEEMRRIIESVN